jgi:hypothetical protein
MSLHQLFRRRETRMNDRTLSVNGGCWWDDVGTALIGKLRLYDAWHCLWVRRLRLCYYFCASYVTNHTVCF